MPQVTSKAMPDLLRQAAIALGHGGVLAMRLLRLPRQAATEVRALLAASAFGDVRDVLTGGERLLIAGAPISLAR